MKEALREKNFPKNMTATPLPASLPYAKTGRIVLFDTRTCWAIIAPNGSKVLPGKITFNVPHHLHLHSSVSLIVGKEYDESAYEYDMSYDLSKEDYVDSYKSIVAWDSMNKYAVLSNGSGRLKITTYSNSRNVVPDHIHLPEHCQIVLHEL